MTGSASVSRRVFIAGAAAAVSTVLAGCAEQSSTSTADQAKKAVEIQEVQAPEHQKSGQQASASDDQASREQATEAAHDDDATHEEQASSGQTKVEVRDGLSYANGVLIVNKKYGLPKDYAPGADPEMMEHLAQLIADMRAAGLPVSKSTSNYRSYARQRELYTSYVQQDGQAKADTYSARPGHSEHQSGLAADLRNSSTGTLLVDDASSEWLDEHAADYGFIVRYKPGWEPTTGYMPEAWHIRYLGKDLAQKVAAANVPLETYLGVEGGDYVE